MFEGDDKPTGPNYFRSAHGLAADGGAILVCEQPPLDELQPLNADRTAKGLASRRVRGRPFTTGNAAGSGRGPSLTHIGVLGPDAPDERRRVQRRAQSLKGKRDRELSVQTGGPLSSGVKVELKAWALASAWADHFYRAGEAAEGAKLAEKASGHALKAIGLAEREANARDRNTPDEDSPLAIINRAVADGAKKAATERGDE